MQSVTMQYLLSQPIGEREILAQPPCRWLRAKAACLAAEPTSQKRFAEFTVRLPSPYEGLETHQLKVEMKGIRFGASPQDFTIFGKADERNLEILCSDGMVKLICVV